MQDNTNSSSPQDGHKNNGNGEPGHPVDFRFTYTWGIGSGSRTEQGHAHYWNPPSDRYPDGTLTARFANDSNDMYVSATGIYDPIAKKQIIKASKGQKSTTTSYSPSKFDLSKLDYGAMSENELGLTRMSAIKEKPVDPLWKNYLALRKMALLAGDGGGGKSQFLLTIASIVSTGGEWPDRSGYAPQGDVIILAAEDDAEDTIKPRLMALGANLDRISILQARVTIKASDDTLMVHPQSLQDLDYWRAVLKCRPNCKLIIIDPLPSYLGRAVNDYKNSEIRSVLEPFIEIIVKGYNVCMYCNTHLNKAIDVKNAVHRIIGSIAYVNLARNVHIIVKDSEDPDRRFFKQAKCNYAPDNLPGLAFRIEPKELVVNGSDVIEIAIPVFESEPVQFDLDKAVNGTARRDEAQIDRAADWLGERLSEGPVESIVCAKEGDAFLGNPWPEGMPERAQLARVRWWRESVLKKRLNGRSQKLPAFQGKWVFTIPGWKDRSLEGLEEATWDQDEAV